MLCLLAKIVDPVQTFQGSKKTKNKAKQKIEVREGRVKMKTSLYPFSLHKSLKQLKGSVWFSHDLIYLFYLRQ